MIFRWGKYPFSIYAFHLLSFREDGRVNSRTRIGEKVSVNSKGSLCNKIKRHTTMDIWEAVKEGDLEKAKKCLDNGEDINVRDNKYGVTLLHVAVINAHIETVRFLIDNGIDVNVFDKFGVTPLRIAVEHGYIEVANFLREKGANINAKLFFTDKPLYNERQNIVGREGKNQGITDVWESVEDGYEEGVKDYLLEGGDVNARNKEGWTFLLLASFHGQTAIARLLIEDGADVNAKDEICGTTPLHYASEEGYIEIVKLLIESGADVNVKDEYYGRTPLHYAYQNKWIEVVNFLIENRADIKIADNNGNTIEALRDSNSYITKNFRTVPFESNY